MGPEKWRHIGQLASHRRAHAGRWPEPRLTGRADTVWLRHQLSREQGRLISAPCAPVLTDEAGGPRTLPAG